MTIKFIKNIFINNPEHRELIDQILKKPLLKVC